MPRLNYLESIIWKKLQERNYLTSIFILTQYVVHERFIIRLKENLDRETIDFALQKSKNICKELQTHLVYAGDSYYYGITRQDKLKSFILDAMKKYKIKSVMVSVIYMVRRFLITKETMENYCKGKEIEKDSVNDDLESFFEDLRLGKEPQEKNFTYFLPKLTEAELVLVGKRDPSYLDSFRFHHVDVPEAEMRLSESKSKFLLGFGCRRTFTINNLKRASN